MSSEMPFRPVEQPDPQSYCDPTVFPIDISRTLPQPPGPGLFVAERQFWSDEALDTYKEERGIGALAGMFREAFGYHTADAREWSDYNSGNLAKRVEHLTNYAYSLATLGLSRFIREMRASPAGFSIGSVGSKEEPEIIVDLNNAETGGSGIHARAEYLERYGLTPPNRGAPAKWYEGEELFVRVSAPAKPTRETQLNYYMAYNTQLPAAKMASAVPRLKRGLWPSQGVIRFGRR